MFVACDVFSLKRLASADSAGTGGTAHAVTIGNFDGVHAGHRALIARTREKAAMLGIPSAIVTFDPHPQLVLAPPPPQGSTAVPASLSPLLSVSRKLELFAGLGLDLALVLPFTPDLAALTPEEFVHSVLLEGLGMRHLAIGYDFALGKKRRGDYAFLSRFGGENGFSVEQLAPVQIDGRTVSSTRIREAVRQGDTETAARLLTRPHSAEGLIVHGFGRGKSIGFPTINVSYGRTMLPPPGVYAVQVELAPDERGERSRPLTGVANIGNNPTFGGTELTLETHIFDFSRDIYGCSARILFMKRLRGEVLFSGPDALTAQIAADAAAARACLAEGSSL